MVVSPHFLRDSTDMPDDQLSEVFDLVEVRGLVSGGFAVRGDWVSRFTIADPLKLVAMVCGRARLTTDGSTARSSSNRATSPSSTAVRGWHSRVAPGTGRAREIVVAAGDAFLRVDGADCGAADVVIGGHVDLNPAGHALLAQALPAVGHVRSGGGVQPACRPRPTGGRGDE